MAWNDVNDPWARGWRNQRKQPAPVKAYGVFEELGSAAITNDLALHTAVELLGAFARNSSNRQACAAVAAALFRLALESNSPKSNNVDTSTHAILEHFEDLLSTVGKVTGVRKVDVTDAKAAPRNKGPLGCQLASRLSRMSKARNGTAHPDVALKRDILALFGGGDMAKDIHGFKQDVVAPTPLQQPASS